MLPSFVWTFGKNEWNAQNTNWSLVSVAWRFSQEHYWAAKPPPPKNRCSGPNLLAVSLPSPAFITLCAQPKLQCHPGYLITRVWTFYHSLSDHACLGHLGWVSSLLTGLGWGGGGGSAIRLSLDPIDRSPFGHLINLHNVVFPFTN